MTEETKHRIILDTDTAMGEGLGLDIDDDLALVFLLNSPEVEILGVTTTYGNSTQGRTYRDAKRLLKRAGRSDIPVFKGAGWMSRDLKKETDSSRFIQETIHKRPGEVTMVTLGPCTNLAAAMESSQGLLSDARELVMMGGRFKDGEAEFNFSAHPGAAAKVLVDHCPTFVVTMDLCFQVVFTMEHIKILEGKPDLVLAPWMGAMRRWYYMNLVAMGFASVFNKDIPTGGFFPWDGIAVAYLVKPELFPSAPRRLMTMKGTKISLDTPSRDDDPRAVRVPMEVDAKGFMDLFIERIGSLTVSGKKPPITTQPSHKATA